MKAAIKIFLVSALILITPSSSKANFLDDMENLGKEMVNPETYTTFGQGTQTIGKGIEEQAVSTYETTKETLKKFGVWVEGAPDWFKGAVGCAGNLDCIRDWAAQGIDQIQKHGLELLTGAAEQGLIGAASGLLQGGLPGVIAGFGKGAIAGITMEEIEINKEKIQKALGSAGLQVLNAAMPALVEAAASKRSLLKAAVEGGVFGLGQYETQFVPNVNLPGGINTQQLVVGTMMGGLIGGLAGREGALGRAAKGMVLGTLASAGGQALTNLAPQGSDASQFANQITQFAGNFAIEALTKGRGNAPVAELEKNPINRLTRRQQEELAAVTRKAPITRSELPIHPELQAQYEEELAAKQKEKPVTRVASKKTKVSPVAELAKNTVKGMVIGGAIGAGFQGLEMTRPTPEPKIDDSAVVDAVNQTDWSPVPALISPDTIAAANALGYDIDPVTGAVTYKQNAIDAAANQGYDMTPQGDVTLDPDYITSAQQQLTQQMGHPVTLSPEVIYLAQLQISDMMHNQIVLFTDRSPKILAQQSAYAKAIRDEVKREWQEYREEGLIEQKKYEAEQEKLKEEAAAREAKETAQRNAEWFKKVAEQKMAAEKQNEENQKLNAEIDEENKRIAEKNLEDTYQIAKKAAEQRAHLDRWGRKIYDQSDSNYNAKLKELMLAVNMAFMGKVKELPLPKPVQDAFKTRAKADVQTSHGQLLIDLAHKTPKIMQEAKAKQKQKIPLTQVQEKKRNTIQKSIQAAAAKINLGTLKPSPFITPQPIKQVAKPIVTRKKLTPTPVVKPPVPTPSPAPIVETVHTLVPTPKPIAETKIEKQAMKPPAPSPKPVIKPAPVPTPIPVSVSKVEKPKPIHETTGHVTAAEHKELQAQREAQMKRPVNTLPVVILGENKNIKRATAKPMPKRAAKTQAKARAATSVTPHPQPRQVARPVVTHALMIHEAPKSHPESSEHQ